MSLAKIPPAAHINNSINNNSKNDNDDDDDDDGNNSKNKIQDPNVDNNDKKKNSHIWTAKLKFQWSNESQPQIRSQPQIPASQSQWHVVREWPLPEWFVERF